MTGSADWVGRVGRLWATEWRRTDRSFAGLTPFLHEVILAAAPDRAIRVLDIGCGAGETAQRVAAALPMADVLGVDLTIESIAAATGRWDMPNLHFVSGDAVAVATGYRPDLFVSRHGVMFFDDPVAAFTALGNAADRDARLVFSCFADRRDNRFAADLLNAVGMDGDADAGTEPGPFAFADPARVGAVLASARWDASPPRRVAFAYRAGAGDHPVADAVDFFSRIGPVATVLSDASPDRRAALIDAVTMACERRCDGMSVEFPAVAWLWSARRAAGGPAGRTGEQA